jgi:ribosomal protein L11 methyltransferase
MKNNTFLWAPPYHNLYIYYIQGQVKQESEKQLFKDHYIGNWIEEDTSFLFFTCPSENKIQALLKIQPELNVNDTFQMTYEEWCGGQFEIISMADYIIAPPWMPHLSSIEKNIIWLDPGVVFGAGTHPTTYDCLQAIQRAFNICSIETMMDMGTGTGLLSLFAARMGAKKILALDLNLLAVKTALMNSTFNHLNQNILTVQGDARTFMGPTVDLWVANIHYDILKSLIETSEFLQHKLFILSGLLPSEAKKVRDLLDKRPVEIIEVWDSNWFTCLGKPLRRFPGMF